MSDEREMSWEYRLRDIIGMCEQADLRLDPTGGWRVITPGKIVRGNMSAVITPELGDTPETAVKSFWESAAMPGSQIAVKPKGCSRERRYEWKDGWWQEVLYRKPRQAAVKAAPGDPAATNGQEAKSGGKAKEAAK